MHRFAWNQLDDLVYDICTNEDADDAAFGIAAGVNLILDAIIGGGDLFPHPVTQPLLSFKGLEFFLHGARLEMTAMSLRASALSIAELLKKSSQSSDDSAFTSIFIGLCVLNINNMLRCMDLRAQLRKMLGED